MRLRLRIDPWRADGSPLEAFNLPGNLVVGSGPIGADDAYPAHRAIEVIATDGTLVRISLDERETADLIRDLRAEVTIPGSNVATFRWVPCPNCQSDAGYLICKGPDSAGMRECVSCGHERELPPDGLAIEIPWRPSRRIS